MEGINEAKERNRTKGAEGTSAESMEIKVRVSEHDSGSWELGVSKAAGRESVGEEVAEGRRGVRGG